MAVSRRLRFEILRRDNHTCRYCGASAPDVKLTVDHVIPTALGGTDDPSNLVAACAGCNGGKSSIAPNSPTVANVAQDALRWSAAISAAAGEMLADQQRRNRARQEFDDAWSGWGFGSEEGRKPVPRPSGWRNSIDSFMAAGLPMPVLLDCLQKAMANKKLKMDDIFRYMCGIAWKKVTELQDAARQQLSANVQHAGEGRGEGYELMYRELIGVIFGGLGGVGSEEDVQVLADLGRDARVEDDPPTVLDTDGFAVVELINRISDLICEAHVVNQAVLDELPAETLAELQRHAGGLHDWPEELRSIDRGYLYREYIRARMAALHLLPELLAEARDAMRVGG